MVDLLQPDSGLPQSASFGSVRLALTLILAKLLYLIFILIFYHIEIITEIKTVYRGEKVSIWRLFLASAISSILMRMPVSSTSPNS